MAEERKEYIKIRSGEMEQPFEWSAGLYGSRFLTELRDNKRLMGIKCPKCGIVYAIPRQVCRTCFLEMDEWVELGNTGTLTTFSVLGFGFIDPDTGIQKPVPYTCAFIRPDGADTAIAHFLDETDTSKIRIGMRVQAVFKEDRKGSLLDIKHFVPIEE